MEEEKKVPEVKEATLEESETEKEVKQPKKKEEKEKSTFSKVINVVLWVIVIAWMAIILTDFSITYFFNKDPLFCINEETHKYDDGEVYICTEIGFKFFRYDRSSYTARQFGGFWTQEYDPNEKK